VIIILLKSWNAFRILTIPNIPFNIIYDFIDDRLNSIKQDATIQEVSNQEWMAILPPIIRFRAYAAYKWVIILILYDLLK